MPGRMDTTPLLVDRERAVRLTRVPFDEHQFDENWLQELLFQHPALIPVQEIEPVFAPLIPVARELPTPSGPLDILYVSPEGYPTLVETKLWRNPEARRQVVAQIIDYAAQMSKWSYDDLLAAVKRALKESSNDDPIVALMETSAEEWDRARFIDTLSRNLRGGRMLLLIVGDGIREDVEHMAETLSGTPQLGFTLGLVEMAVFRLSERPDELLVQPRLVARTREVVRAIVEIRKEVEVDDVRVTVPPDGDDTTPRRRRALTEDAFFEKLAEQASSKVADELRGFLADLDSCRVVVVARAASLSLHYYEPSGKAHFGFGSVFNDGIVDMFYVVFFFQTAGYDEQIGKDYLSDVACLAQGARVHLREAKTGLYSAIKIGKNHVTIEDLLPRKTEWLAAIERMISRINSAAKTADLG